MHKYNFINRIQTRVTPKDEANLPGTVEVLDGKVRIPNPKGLGKYPSITPGQNTIVTVNDQVIDGTVVVAEKDQIKVQLPNMEPVFTYEIEVTPDKMTAKIIINRKLGEFYILNELKPANHCLISAAIASYYHPEYPTIGQVLAKLEEMGITYGIDYDLIEQIIEKLPKTTDNLVKAEIAHGQVRVEGKDAEVVYIAPGLKNKQSFGQSQPVVNPFGQHKVDSVSPGDVIAGKNLPEQGINGVDVFGKPIECTNPRDIIIQAGDGVVLIKESTVVATKPGHPRVTKISNYIYKFSVVPIMVIAKDLDISAGNINFDGDVVIYGSILEGLRVEATGEVHVSGNVIMAEIIAGNHVKIGRNVISSRIRAGYNNQYILKSVDILEEIVMILKNLVSACNQVKTTKAFREIDLIEGESKLIYLLVRGKYRMLEKLIRDFYRLSHTSDEAVNPEIVDLSRILFEFFCREGTFKIKSIHDISQVREATEILIKKLESPKADSCDVVMYYCQNSVIDCSGDIYINGFGAWSSELNAE